MPLYYLSLGSNVGDRLAHLQSAAQALMPECTGMRAAPVYETAPVDCPPGSASFYNTVLEIHTPLPPAELHTLLLSLEKAAGRPTERSRNAPRPLDIDILDSTARHQNSESLMLPHPRMTQRRFVLKPLCQLNPDYLVDGQSAASHLAALADDPSEVTEAIGDWLPFAEYPLTCFAGLARRKTQGPPVTVLTAYDYPTARLMDEAGIDLILVGDSLGMVVLGLPDTTHVTMAHMLHHTEAVARGAKRARIIADLPYHSYLTPEQAVENARLLMQAGAHAVKLEGGVSQLPQVQAILAAGIPLVGHIGMLPQSILEEGGRYKKKGKTTDGAAALLRDAEALSEAGVAAMVLESVVPEVATEITRKVSAVTIGIGSGNATDGQVLVVSDLVGGFPWFRPPFATVHADTAGQTRHAIEAFIRQTLR